MSYSSIPNSSSDGLPKGIGLSNTIHSEVASCFSKPSLPVLCGASDPELQLFDEPKNVGYGSSRSSNQQEILAHASIVADLLYQTDVSYLNIRDDTKSPCGYVEPSELHDLVIQCNPEAFEYAMPGHIQHQNFVGTSYETMPLEPIVPATSLSKRNHAGSDNQRSDHDIVKDALSSSKKTKFKRKVREDVTGTVRSDPGELQDANIRNFSELLENFCNKAEIVDDDKEEAEWLLVPATDIRMLVNEVMTIRAKDLLHLVPVDTLVKLLRVLDHQVHRAEGLSIDEFEHSDTDVVATVICALESIHVSLAVMAHKHMPKQLYKEEIIERILEFSKHQISDVMSAYDPAYRALHKPSEDRVFEGNDEDDPASELGSASKRRRSLKSNYAKKSALNKVSGAVNNIFQKLCTILGLLKDLLMIERLSDSCILQLLKTGFTTFLVDNIQLLQLKAIGLITGIFYSYTQHRMYVMDEILQLLVKLPPISKRTQRAYHLPDEEHMQIQMVSAMLVQLVHNSANLPETLRQASSGNFTMEATFDVGCLTKCHEAATETCCRFWTRILQRFASAKTTDASEVKVMVENLVSDLLTTLNLPEYPSSAPLLEVLCVLLLQNAGLKAKDVSARCMAIDLLGTVAARLKQDAVLCKKNKFWMFQESASGDNVQKSHSKDACSVCLGGRNEKQLFLCQVCQRVFHSDCMGVKEHEVPSKSWHCQFCFCRKQLLVLQTYCKSPHKHDEKKRSLLKKNPEASVAVTKVEILQQMLTNYFQDAGYTDDSNLFIRWFYLCLWYKDDPKSEHKFDYYLARMSSKAIVPNSGTSSLLTRDSAKWITLALGQNSSFSRGFDKILHLLLASLTENSSVIRAKALRAVSIIVEADPEVLGDERVQSAVEGRFRDTAISVREAALELVGRHIASYPDVGAKYFERVSERILDTGVSVRKRAIKIVRDMCTSNSNFSGFTSACIEIIARISDVESSIQDLVCKTFYEFWFEEPSGSQMQYFGDGSSVPLEVAKKTEQIVEVLKRMPNHHSIATVIKRNLSLDFFAQSAKAAGINPVLLASVRKRCELMCKYLLERILQVEEMSCDKVELRTLPYVLLLHAFCAVDSTFCAPTTNPFQFVVTLQPYLKSQGDKREVAQLLESIISIINAIIPLMRKLPQNVTEELEQDLKHMIIRHSFLTVVHACIKCLCSVSKAAGKGASAVEYLIQVFFKRLDSLGTDSKQLGRSLFCLGLLVRYGNALLVASGGEGLVVRNSLSLFKKYLGMEDFGLRIRSLQALGFLLIARPECMLQEDVGYILNETLSSSNVRVKMQGLQNMYEYLLDAEIQMENDKMSNNGGHYSIENGVSVPVAAGAGDTNICGGIVQLYWNNILERCLDFSESVRQITLKIVEIVLRQGLVHPISCVPYLIALETDPKELNSKLAHHLLMNMNEKYPSFFESRLGDGLQMSFIFMQAVCGGLPENLNQKTQTAGNWKGKSDNTSLTQTRLGVSRIYKLIRGNRVSRNKFMSSIVRKFDSPTISSTVVPFLMYCSEVLALLPFTLPDEPLYLIYAINRVLQVRAGSLEANMKGLIMHLSESGAQRKRDLTQTDLNSVIDLNQKVQQEPIVLTSFDLNGTSHQEIDDPPAYITPSENVKPDETSLYECYSISEDIRQKIQFGCLSGVALQLLMKLKRHLKIVYSLNDSRCQAFSPNEPPKPGEALSRQSVPFDIRETRTDLSSTYEDLLEGYQEFKCALKEDTVDYSTYTANIKRKRPTPKKGAGPRRVSSYYEDDENDDTEFIGGARNVGGSGRKPYITRGSRQ